jgi:hypothetical protein
MFSYSYSFPILYSKGALINYYHLPQSTMRRRLCRSRTILLGRLLHDQGSILIGSDFRVWDLVVPYLRLCFRSQHTRVQPNALILRVSDIKLAVEVHTSARGGPSQRPEDPPPRPGAAPNPAGRAADPVGATGNLTSAPSSPATSC